MTIPVRLGEGQLICPTLLQLVVHGLPSRLCRQGLGQTILRCAGYSETECRVEGEFLGDLPARFSGGHAATQVGNSDACLIFITAPAADRRLARLPRYFSVGQEKVYISKPGQLRKPSRGQPPQQPPAPPPSAGPRPIRVRQRAAAAARSSQAPPQPPTSGTQRSHQLQALETHISRSRTPGTDRRGLGSAAARAAAAAPAAAAFVAATDSQPAVPMDCQPPIGADVLPAIGHATAMDIDASVAPCVPTAMDCDPPPPPPPQPRPQQQPQPSSDQRERKQFERDMAGVSMDMVDACFEWLTVHTHYGVSDIRAAFRRLFDAEPDCLLGSPSEAAVQGRLTSILQRLDSSHAAHVDDRAPGPPPRPRSSPHMRQRRRCDFPPGYEVQAAQMAVAQAMQDLAPIRRSQRSRLPPREWWQTSSVDTCSDTRTGPSTAGRRPARP